METQLKTGRAALDQLREDRAGRSSEVAKLRSDLEHLEASCLAEVNVEAQVLRADAEIARLAARNWPPKKKPAAGCASASSRWAR
jgi:chromosome segregation protein